MADFEAYCAAPEGDVAVHICGVYDITNDIVTGVDTFFLLFAVSSYRISSVLTRLLVFL
jgi:hypothetical protein